MAVVATITISAVNYSVYGLTSDALLDANNYFAARLGATAWSNATTLQRQQALITAVRMMDRRAEFTGEETSASQPLEWPRDGATCNGEAVADGTIPDKIALGEFELALQLLIDADIQNTANNGSNVKSVKAGSAGVEFFVPTITSGDATAFPQAVMELIGCYLATEQGLDLGPFVSGTDVESSFDDEDYGLTGGL